MHAPTFKHIHFPPELLHFVEQHLMASIIASIIVIGLVLSLSTPLSPPVPLQEVSVPVTPLLLLNSPERIHEFPVRINYINRQLQQLQLSTNADRVYAFAYSDSSAYRGSPDITIAHVFEVTKPGFTNRMNAFQGFSRLEWLQLQSMEQSVGGLSTISPNSYGVELHDTQGNAIGYAGFEFESAFPEITGDERLFLYETVPLIEAGMLQALDQLPGRQ